MENTVAARNGSSLSRRRALAGGLAGLAFAGVSRAALAQAGQRGEIVRNQDQGVAARLGFHTAGLDGVTELFADMLDEGLHPGAQLAIYRDGELALELAGGVDHPGGRPVTPDTLYQIRSTTKALTAMVMMQAFERGRFHYRDRVADHWLEFAQNGKDAVTIAQVLSHQAGIPDGPRIGPARMGDRAAVAEAVARMSPIWPPGTANGYHAQTIGWVCDELLRRWEGVGTGELLARDILRPLGASDVFLGLPRSEFARMAPMSIDAEVREHQGPRAEFSDFLNTPEGIALPLPWVSAVANARSLAKTMCLPALRGEVAGRRYFSAATQAIVSAPTNPPGRMDLRLRAPIRWGLGFILGDTPNIYGSTPRPTAIGHAGGGANLIWGDPESRLAVAFVCNRMLNGRESFARYRSLGDAIYASLAA